MYSEMASEKIERDSVWKTEEEIRDNGDRYVVEGISIGPYMSASVGYTETGRLQRKSVIECVTASNPEEIVRLREMIDERYSVDELYYAVESINDTMIKKVSWTKRADVVGCVTYSCRLGGYDDIYAIITISGSDHEKKYEYTICRLEGHIDALRGIVDDKMVGIMGGAKDEYINSYMCGSSRKPWEEVTNIKDIISDDDALHAYLTNTGKDK